MHRRPLLELLSRYRPSHAEVENHQRFGRLVSALPECFQRNQWCGHVTGSVWVVNPDKTKVLLVKHRKLKRWLQPGGHADGDSNILKVALRELEEETGLTPLTAVKDEIFDLDIHPIAGGKSEPAHEHFDVRFLVEADDTQPLRVSQESLAVEWVSLQDLQHLEVDESLIRMSEKLRDSR